MRNNYLPPQPNSSDNPDPASGTGHISCAELDALLPAYAIGATDPAETAVIAAHLQLCPTHAAELAKSRTLAQGLLFGAGEVQPPARIANQLRRLVDQPLTRAQPRPVVANTSAREPQPSLWRWSAMWSAAAASLIILLGALNFYWVRQNLSLRQAYMALATRHEAQNTTQTQHQEVLALLTNQGIRFIDLPTTQENTTAHAEVMWNPKVDVAVLYVEALPNLPTDQVYQLWLTYKGERQSGGLFTVDDQGNGVHIFPLPLPLDQVEAIGVTPEPTGGSVSPTADPVVRRKF